MRAAQGATRTSHLKTPARSYGRWWYVKRARIFLGCTPRSTASRSRSAAPKMVSRGRYAFSMTSAIAVLHDFSNGPPSSFSGPFFGSPDKWRQLPIAERIFRTLQVAPVSNRRVNIRSLTFQEFLRAFKKFPTKSLKEGPSPAATAATRSRRRAGLFWKRQLRLTPAAVWSAHGRVRERNKIPTGRATRARSRRGRCQSRG